MFGDKLNKDNQGKEVIAMRKEIYSLPTIHSFHNQGKKKGEFRLSFFLILCLVAAAVAAAFFRLKSQRIARRPLRFLCDVNPFF